MSDKRSFPRRFRRILVDFVYDGSNRTGFTRDLSHTGLFVATTHVPPPGKHVEVSLSLPDGRKITVSGKVARTRRTPTALAQTDPSGFSLQLAGYFEKYFLLLESLEGGTRVSDSSS